MTLQNFGDNENWVGFLMSGQPYDLDCGLSEDMEALDVGGRHLGSQGIGGPWCVCVCISQPF